MKSNNVIIAHKKDGLSVEVPGIIEFSVKGAIPSDINVKYEKALHDTLDGVRALKPVLDALIEMFVPVYNQERFKQGIDEFLSQKKDTHTNKEVKEDG